MMKMYRKKTLFDVIYVLDSGDYVICDINNPDDISVVPKKVFESTYQEVRKHATGAINARTTRRSHVS